MQSHMESTLNASFEDINFDLPLLQTSNNLMTEEKTVQNECTSHSLQYHFSQIQETLD